MRVLVVDDEPDVLYAVSTFLKEEGYSVDTAEDGEEGLEKAIVTDYDMILMDVMMPKRDGLSVLDEIRRRKKATPVILLTARDRVEDRIQGLDTGADDYLAKPFELSELLARMRSLIRRSLGNGQSVIEIGRIWINTTSRTVTLEGESVDLTSKEYRLLEYLALHRGEVVTREKISDLLIDDNAPSSSGQVDTYISNIRSKVGRTVIKTKRGSGFMIARDV